MTGGSRGVGRAIALVLVRQDPGFAVTPGFVHADLTRRMIGLPERGDGFPRLRPATRAGLDLELFIRLTVTVALGGADALSGRFLHALDDVSELLRRIEEIDRQELYVLGFADSPLAKGCLKRPGGAARSNEVKAAFDIGEACHGLWTPISLSHSQGTWRGKRLASGPAQHFVDYARGEQFADPTQSHVA